MSGAHASPLAWGSHIWERPSCPKQDPRELHNRYSRVDRSAAFNSLSKPIFSPRQPSSFTFSVQNLPGQHSRPRSPRKRTRSVLPLPADAASSLGQALLVNTPMFLASRQSRQRILTPAGLRHAYGLGVLLWTTLSWRGYALCFLFLILGSALTRVGQEKKEALGIAEKRGGARGPENLWGAAGVAAVLAVCTFLARGVGASELETWLMVGYAGALAAKFSDTAGSEIGKAYGTETYRFGTWERVKAGVEGGVSIEGSVASVAGAVLAAGVAWGVGLVNGSAEFGLVCIAGIVASTLESAVGGRFQDELGLSNEAVNVVNTFVGAVVGMGLHGVRLWVG